MVNSLNNHRKNLLPHGFTLVEISLVFLIAGFFFYIVGSTASSRIEAERMKTTQQRLAIIMKAIEQYARTYKHLPCPADPTLGIDNASFGDGTGTNTLPTALCNASNIQRSSTAPRGAVPVKQLNLNPRVAADGWDRKFTYVVSLPYTNATGYSSYHTAFDGTGGTKGTLQITTAGGGYVIAPAGNSLTDSYAAVLVLSHGPNGYGAYIRDGNTVLPCATSLTDELNNANIITGSPNNANDTYVSIFSLQGTGTATYDDIVDYRMRWQLVQP